MSTVLIAIPVLKDSRRFHLEKGRRWTIMEHMLLEALARRDWSIDDLRDASNLPRRVVIEIVIRLMRAGWVELRVRASGLEFNSTPTGRLYATREDLPPVTRTATRFIGFVVDLVSGGMYRGRDLMTVNEEQWRQRREGRIWAELEVKLTEESVQPDVQVLADRLLESDERLTRVDVQDRRPRRLWGLVSVRGNEIEGLAGDIPDRLKTAILAAAARARGAAPATPAATPPAQPASRPARETRQITFRNDDLIMGGAAHHEAFARLLGRAQHRVVIHSTFIDPRRLDALLALVRQPVQKGAVIDVLWGQSREKHNVNGTREAALSLRTLVAAEGLQDRVRVHMTSSRSHAKLLLADTGDARKFQAVLGSCNWLSSDFAAFDVSCRLRDPALVAELANDLAELARPPDGQIPDLSIELLRLAAAIREESPPTGGKSTGRIVTAAEHASILTRAREESRERIMVLSHRLDVAAKPALKALSAAAGTGGTQNVQAIYGRLGDTVRPEQVVALTRAVASEGVVLAEAPAKLHAKVLAWDADHILISSLNMLSSDPSSANPRQELGVLIQAPEAARLLYAAIEDLPTSRAKDPITDE